MTILSTAPLAERLMVVAPKVTEFGVVVGTACNFRCAHCASVDDSNYGLTSPEISSIINTINTHHFKSLFFVGGETTFYLPSINRILTAVEKLESKTVRIVTNGSFASNPTAAKKCLSSFLRLTHVSLSYDKYHSKFLPLSSVKTLYEVCKSLNIKFDVTTAISSPTDLAILNTLVLIGKFPVSIQHVMPVGRAKNKVAMRYPSLDKKVLSYCCPIRNQIFYLCGRGYSTCCGSLIFSGDNKDFVKSTFDKYMSSSFYNVISRYSFGELMQKYNIPLKNLRPEHSVGCTLCTHIFANKHRFS